MRRQTSVFVVLIATLALSVSAFAKTITFWASNADYQQYADAFNAQSADLKVEFVHKPRINEALLTAIAGGTPPDVARIDRFEIGQFAIRDVLLPLNEYIARDGIDLNDFYAPLIEELTYRGQLYGVPFHVDTRLLYYNKGVFSAVGLDPNVAPATWNDLEEYARKINDIQGRRIRRLAFNPTGSQWPFFAYLWTNGGDFFNEDKSKVIFNGPEGLETLEWIYHMTENVNGGMVLADAFAATFQGEGNTGVHWALYSGLLAMTIAPPYVMGELTTFGPAIEYGVAPPPIPEDGIRVNFGGGFGFGIPKNTPNKEEAWEFIKFLISYDGQMSFVTETGIGGALSSRIDVNRDAEVFQDPYWQAFAAEIPYARFRPVTPVTAQVIDTLNEMVERTVYRRMTPAQALEWAAGQAQRLLDSVQGQF